MLIDSHALGFGDKPYYRDQIQGGLENNVQSASAILEEQNNNNLQNGADQRQAQRNQAHDLSEIILDGRKYGVACMIHNISQSGALLEVSCGDLPKRFVLANYTKKTKTLCRQVWRDNRLIGVNFLTSPRSFEFFE